MYPSSLRLLCRFLVFSLLALIPRSHARIGGYSHRSTTKTQPVPAQQYQEPAQAVQESFQQATGESSPALAQAGTRTQAYPISVPVAGRTQLPPPPAANNAYELMNMLEAQNKQLREQIALLERESNVLLHRNRALRSDKRRLQHKRRKLSERVDVLEEQILKTASLAPRYSSRNQQK